MVLRSNYAFNNDNNTNQMSELPPVSWAFIKNVAQLLFIDSSSWFGQRPLETAMPYAIKPNVPRSNKGPVDRNNIEHHYGNKSTSGHNRYKLNSNSSYASSNTSSDFISISINRRNNNNRSKAATNCKGKNVRVTRRDFCVLCKSNKEPQSFYSSHTLRDNNNNVVCPILKQYTCAKCGQKGDHTLSYCPLNRTRVVSAGHLLYKKPAVVSRNNYNFVGTNFSGSNHNL